MKLQYITRGMGDARGKPRVFLTCHPEDREKAIPLIAEDLLRHVNCAVWYDAEPAAEYDPWELRAALDEMQLFVAAVSSKFLYSDHRAKDVELKYALERHIPVLPILLESGLSREFNRITDTKIQVVYRTVSDPTATPYEEVLDTYLKSVLVGDELAEKVRDAFDAYVFLSYRKKDRRHAQRLMHLIHENKQFRDIAIWYDEFLVPGENYNDAIRDAFEKSGLFALAVTPSLLEPEKPTSPSAAYHRLKVILKGAGLPDIRFHDLRHTFATHAMRSGVDAKTLSGILGHTNASFTLDTYTHVTNDMQKNAANIVGGFMEELFGKELKPWQN